MIYGKCANRKRVEDRVLGLLLAPLSPHPPRADGPYLILESQAESGIRASRFLGICLERSQESKVLIWLADAWVRSVTKTKSPVLPQKHYCKPLLTHHHPTKATIVDGMLSPL